MRYLSGELIATLGHAIRIAAEDCALPQGYNGGLARPTQGRPRSGRWRGACF